MKHVEDKIRPTIADLQFARAFVSAQIEVFENEEARSNSLRLLLGSYFEREIRKKSIERPAPLGRGGRKLHCDGISYSNWADGGQDQHLPPPLLILGVNQEIGMGGTCPFVKSAAYYSLSLQELPEQVLLDSCAPCIVLTVAGPRFQVSFFAAGDGDRETAVCGEPVTHYIELRNDSISDIANVMKSLKICIAALDRYYVDKEYLTESLQFFTSAILSEKSSCLIPRAQLFPSMLVFRCYDYEARSSRVLKLTTRYCIEAHKLLAVKGFAPMVHDFWEVSGTDFFAVVMDVCEGEMLSEWLYSQQATADNISRVIAILEEALQVLHESGYVHGDFRPCNVMVNVKEGSIYLQVIDFDWAGAIGEVAYPYDVNTDLEYFGGPGDSITELDDLHCISKLKREV